MFGLPGMQSHLFTLILSVMHTCYLGNDNCCFNVCVSRSKNVDFFLKKDNKEKTRKK